MTNRGNLQWKQPDNTFTRLPIEALTSTFILCAGWTGNSAGER